MGPQSAVRLIPPTGVTKVALCVGRQARAVEPMNLFIHTSP